MSILQVYPRLPPAIDGIGDYSLKIANGLMQRYGVKTYFLTAQQPNQSIAIEYPVIELAALTAESFVRSMPEYINKVILHFSDYPYDPRRGAPFWLAEALKTLKQQRSIQLLVVFHEFPTFYLLKKTFYLFPWQRSAAWRIAELADIIFTNNAATKKILTQRLSQPVVNLPVFSNIGELNHPPRLNQRARRLIIFGTADRRARIYQRSRAVLAQACQALDIEEICDVGPALNLSQTEVANVRLVEMGEQPSEVIQALMADSFAGLVYSSDNQRLAKSGVFATYCAHGLVPIVTNAASAQDDGLTASTHFLPANALSALTIDRLQLIAEAAHQWYITHNQASTIDQYASQLGFTQPIPTQSPPSQAYQQQ